MASRSRQSMGPAYLFLCLTFGGSAGRIWQDMVLQLLGLAIIAWAAWPAAGQSISRPARHLLVITILSIGLIAIQMVPLSPAIWMHLGGRGLITDGYRILGMDPPWLPLSVTPYRSLDSLLGLIPPLALLVAVVGLGAYRSSWLAAALLLGTIVRVVLGAFEVSGSGSIADVSWHPSAHTSYGLATGFFAATHMANLLVCTLPFLAALLVSAGGRNSQRMSALVAAVAAAALLVVVGMALNPSIAVYALAPPVLAASALILFPRSSWRRWWGIAVVFLAVGAVIGLATTSVPTGQFGSDVQSSAQSRGEMLATTERAMRDFFPWGSGLGSFRSVHQLYEDPTRISGTYVPHAHNDYVELALETGVPGILLMLAFLAWWGRAVWRAWHPDGGVYARAASIASGAILLHSLVDFPLRTVAVSPLFAMCLAMLAERAPSILRSTGDLRPTRHVVVG